MWISVIAFWIKKGWCAWQTIRACVINLCAFYRSCPPDPMLSGQGKTLWCTPRVGYRGSNPRWILNLIFNCVYTKILFKLCSCIYEIQKFLQENVKICTLFSHFASIYWLCPWIQLGNFYPPDALAPPILVNSWPTSCETPKLRSPGRPTPMVQLIQPSFPPPKWPVLCRVGR